MTHGRQLQMSIKHACWREIWTEHWIQTRNRQICQLTSSSPYSIISITLRWPDRFPAGRYIDRWRARPGAATAIACDIQLHGDQQLHCMHGQNHKRWGKIQAVRCSYSESVEAVWFFVIARPSLPTYKTRQKDRQKIQTYWVWFKLCFSLERKYHIYTNQNHRHRNNQHWAIRCSECGHQA